MPDGRICIGGGGGGGGVFGRDSRGENRIGLSVGVEKRGVAEWVLAGIYITAWGHDWIGSRLKV